MKNNLLKTVFFNKWPSTGPLDTYLAKSLNVSYFLLSSGSAETLLKKNAEPILHIAGLDVTIVKVKSDLLLMI